MATDDVSKLRNVAIVGQGGTGKTTVADALLFAAGASTRIAAHRRSASAVIPLKIGFAAIASGRSNSVAGRAGSAVSTLTAPPGPIA